MENKIRLPRAIGAKCKNMLPSQSFRRKAPEADFRLSGRCLTPVITGDCNGLKLGLHHHLGHHGRREGVGLRNRYCEDPANVRSSAVYREIMSVILLLGYPTSARIWQGSIRRLSTRWTRLREWSKSRVGFPIPNATKNH